MKALGVLDERLPSERCRDEWESMAFFVYVIRCVDDSYYTGHTDDLEKRMAAHNRGEVSGYTLGRRPVQLVFVEEFTSREDAFQLERKIKGWSRKKKEALMVGRWEDLPGLSRRRSGKLG